MSQRIFLAADVITAFLDRNDPKHLQASAFFRYFAQEHFYLYTNSEIVIAVYQNISKGISTSFAKEFLKVLSESTIHTLAPDEQEVRKAIQLVTTSYTDVGLQEALILVMAQKHYIPQIATFSYLHNIFGRETFYLPL